MSGQITVQVIIIGAGVFLSQSRGRVEYFNELILMMVLYTMLCFSPWISDVELKFNIGYICIGFVVIHLLVNLSIIFGATVSILKQRFRMYMAMRHLKKYR